VLARRRVPDMNHITATAKEATGGTAGQEAGTDWSRRDQHVDA
jgi:hypothetical protein